VSISSIDSHLALYLIISVYICYFLILTERIIHALRKTIRNNNVLIRFLSSINSYDQFLKKFLKKACNFLLTIKLEKRKKETHDLEI